MSQYVTNMPPKGQSHACPALLEYALSNIMKYLLTDLRGWEHFSPSPMNPLVSRSVSK